MNTVPLLLPGLNATCVIEVMCVQRTTTPPGN